MTRQRFWRALMFDCAWVSWLGAPAPRRREAERLRLEVLEGRCVPATITPTTFADGGLGSGSLRDAVLQFNADTGTDDDVIQLEAGTYALSIPNSGNRHETAGLTGDLNLTQRSHRWIIQGAGSSGDNATIIDASQLQDRVFQIVTPGIQVVFQDLVLQGGLAQDDGADGAVAGRSDALGGGLLNNGGNVTLSDVVAQNNRAQGGDAAAQYIPGYNASGGGIYSAGGALTLAGATLANNQVVGGRGGPAYSYPNYAGAGGAGSGGGLYATGGSLDISNSMIATNHATGGRGGDGYATYQCTSQGYYCTTHLYGGSGGGGEGGGLYVNGGALTLETSTLANDQVTGGAGGFWGYDGRGLGGGLRNAGTLTVSASTLSGNTGYGGGIYSSGTLMVNNSTITGNSGGIVNYHGTATVTGSTLSGNSGRGIENDGYYGNATLTVSNSTLSGNSTASSGGGISNSGTLTVSNSTLSGNTAFGFYGGGGGIYNDYPGTLMVSNSTLSGNSTTYGYGGGIYTYANANIVTLTNVTLTANRAVNGSGGGLYVYGNYVLPVLHNTLIAGNFHGATGTTADDVNGTLASSGDNNLIGDGTGMTGLVDGVNGNQVGTAANPIDPLLGPLADNGGPTLTHALLPGSPALDAGNNAYATDWDQRGDGFPRVVNDAIDIGAFEYQGDGSAPRAARARARPLADPAAVLARVPPAGDGQRPGPAALAAPPPSPGATDHRPTPAAATAPPAARLDQWFAAAAKRPAGAGAPWDDDLDPLAAGPAGLVTGHGDPQRLAGLDLARSWPGPLI